MVGRCLNTIIINSEAFMQELDARQNIFSVCKITKLIFELFFVHFVCIYEDAFS